MSEYLTINENEYIHLTSVKRIRKITDEERASLSRLGKHVNAVRFNTRIDASNNKKSYAPETIDQIAAQGVALVQIDEGVFIPRNNIGRTKNITSRDRKSFEEKTGRPMREDFKSRVETKAGMVLATVDSATIMRRMGQANRLDLSRAAPDHSAGQKNLSAQRDAVMGKTAPDQSTKIPANGPDHTP